MLYLDTQDLISGVERVEIKSKTEEIYKSLKEKVSEYKSNKLYDYNLDCAILDKIAEIRFCSDLVCIESKPITSKTVLTIPQFLERVPEGKDVCYANIEPSGLYVELVYGNGKLVSITYTNSSQLRYKIENVPDCIKSYIEGIKDVKSLIVKGYIVCDIMQLEELEDALNGVYTSVDNVVECLTEGYGELLKFIVSDIDCYNLVNCTFTDKIDYASSTLGYDAVEAWSFDYSTEQDIISTCKDIVGIYQDDENPYYYLSHRIRWKCEGTIYYMDINEIDTYEAEIAGIAWEIIDGDYIPHLLFSSEVHLGGDVKIDSANVYRPINLLLYDIKEGCKFDFTYSRLLGVIPVVCNNIEIEECLSDYIRRV